MSHDPDLQPPRNPSPWRVPEREKPSSSWSKAAFGLILFAGGAGVILFGAVIENTIVMTIGGAMVVGGGGLAALHGETMAREIHTQQGGGAARKAREQAASDFKERQRAGHRNRDETAAGLAHDPRDDDPGLGPR